MVYGGVNDDGKCLGDLWEMRCIVDSNESEQFYWIPLLKTDLTEWPGSRYNHNSADFKKSIMYMWGGEGCLQSYFSLSLGDLWEYNLTSRMWSRMAAKIGSPFVNTYGMGSFYYQRLNAIVTVTDDDMYALKSLNGSLQFDVMRVKNRDDNYFFLSCSSWVVAGEDTVFFGSDDETIRVWNVDLQYGI